MPHDFNDTEVNVGDLVFIPAKVTAVYQTEDGKFCNLNLETVHPMPPYETGTTVVLNTKQVVVFSKGLFKSVEG
jgi:hypothetical protein